MPDLKGFSRGDSLNNRLHQIVKPFIPAGTDYKLSNVQSLWSGYGEITRCQLMNDTHSSFITKVIMLDAFKQGDKPKHPRAWQSDFAHQRKLSSYRNECRFYTNYSQQTNEQCAVPRFMAADISDSCISLVMEDLDARGLSLRHMQANNDIAATGIKWLANFHARFLQQSLNGLWPLGTYWHLATRPQEYATMQASALKENAEAIDKKLNQATYQTLLHGDAKIANFCFSKDAKQTALVDFQYTGRGVGVKDLIYFLGSCYSERELAKYAEPLTNLYFQTLHERLQTQAVSAQHADVANLQKTDYTLLEQEWRGLIPYAWADFERFLAGWAPEHKKRHDYSQAQTALALSRLNN